MYCEGGEHESSAGPKLFDVCRAIISSQGLADGKGPGAVRTGDGGSDVLIQSSSFFGEG